MKGNKDNSKVQFTFSSKETFLDRTSTDQNGTGSLEKSIAKVATIKSPLC